MRRFALATAALVMGALLSAPAKAEIDPLTRQPLLVNPEGFKAQATAIPRETVTYNSNYAPGTILVDTRERRLYFVLSNSQAIRYGVGVGRRASSGAAPRR